MSFIIFIHLILSNPIKKINSFSVAQRQDISRESISMAKDEGDFKYKVNVSWGERLNGI